MAALGQDYLFLLVEAYAALGFEVVVIDSRSFGHTTIFGRIISHHHLLNSFLALLNLLNHSLPLQTLLYLRILLPFILLPRHKHLLVFLIIQIMPLFK